MNSDRMKKLMTRMALRVDKSSDFKNMEHIIINQDLAKLLIRKSDIGNYVFLHLSHRDEDQDGHPIHHSVRMAPMDTWDILPGMIYCVPTQNYESWSISHPETKHVFLYRQFGEWDTCRMYIWNGKDA